MCVIALAISESVREPRRNLSQEAESSLIGMNYQFVLIFGDFKREEVRYHGGFIGLTPPFTRPRRTTLISPNRAARGSVCNGLLPHVWCAIQSLNRQIDFVPIVFVVRVFPD